MKPTSTKNRSFCKILDDQARKSPHKIAITHIDNKLNVLDEITYHALVSRAKSVAACLQSEYHKGDVCLIIIKPGLEFIVAFLGCLYAGLIALPVHPPRRNRHNSRLWAILDVVKPSVVLMDSEVEKNLEKSKDNLDTLLELPVITVEVAEKSDPEHYIDPGLTAEDIAFLQFTSGTTGKPNGTIVTHHGILHNSEVIKQSFGHDSKLIVATWLPPYHDMGLIGTLLQPIYVGGSNVILDTHSFLIHPVSWLNAISSYRATTVGCPNFALDLLTDKITPEQKKEIDLSSVKVFFCGSEPVKRLSIKRFAKYFKECGFKESMFLPCYGLAENTLMATGISYKESPKYIRIKNEILSREKRVELTNEIGGTSYVSCGYTWLDDEVIIVDPESRIEQGDGRLGEIWINGKSVSKGYWNQDLKQASNYAQLSSEPNETYLRTGDLGFFHDKHLYVTDRMKDVIIINGKNHFPSEIESTIENCHPALQPNGCVVLGTEGQSTENLLVIQELRRSYIRNSIPEEIIEAIRGSLALRHELSASTIELVFPGQLCRTSSGKKQRSKCRQQWFDGLFKIAYGWEKETDIPQSTKVPLKDYDGLSLEQIQDWMVCWLSNKINIDKEYIIPDKPILSYGLDSLGAVELEREVKEKFNITIHPLDFMENNSISALAKIGYENCKQNHS